MALTRWARRTTKRLVATVWRRAVEADIDAELADHVASAAAYHEARGLSPEAARRAALVALGGLEASRERLRDVRRVRLVEDVIQDVRYGLRALARTPSFTSVALATLAIGIGANTAVFTVVDGTLLRPMPFFEPDRVVAPSFAPVSGSFRPGPALLDLDFLPFRATQTVFGGVAASSLRPFGATLTGSGDPVRLRRLSVTPNYFSVLGVVPLLGRPFAPGDADPGRDHVVIVSAAVWRGRLGSDPTVTARSLRLDGEDYRIVGVAPDGFAFPDRVEVWTPFDVHLMPGRISFLAVLARLKPGISVAQATEAVKAFIAQQPPTRADLRFGPEWAARVVPAQEIVVANARLPIQVFAGAVGFVLLIACANVANLLLVRAAGRTRELAVRAALGAGRARLVRQLLTESTLLAATGGMLGLAVAMVGVRGLRALAPIAVLPRPDLVRIDGWVLGFTAVASMFTGLAFGLWPALQATRSSSRHVVPGAGRGSTAGGERARAALAAAEIAMALVLLAGGTLLLKSFVRLESIDPGFEADHRLAVAVSLPAAVYDSPTRVELFHGALLQRLAGLDGVNATTSSNDRPLGTTWTMGTVTLPGGRPLPAGWSADKVSIGPDYFRTMGIPLLAGREFTAADDSRGAGVVIISETAAKTLWPSGHALGQQLALTDNPTPADWVTIVGVVSDVHQQRLDKAAGATTYQPIAQTTFMGFLSHATFIMRTTADPAALAPAVRAAVHAIDPNLPVETLTPLPDLISATSATPRFQAWLVGVFALVAVTLAAIGVSGVLSYSVTQRTREIGIRLALGASTSQVMALVLRRTLAVAAAGIAVGLSAAWLVTRVLSSVLFEIQPHDPAAFAAATGLLLLVALLAALGPAWRARSVNPVIAFRLE